MSWRSTAKNILHGSLAWGRLITSLFSSRTKKAQRIIEKTAEISGKVEETGILDESKRDDFHFCPSCGRKYYLGEANFCSNCGRRLTN